MEKVISHPFLGLGLYGRDTIAANRGLVNRYGSRRAHHEVRPALRHTQGLKYWDQRY